VDANCLNDALQAEFDSPDADRRVVVRQATDLADAGKAEADRGCELTVDDIVAQLQDAPDDADLIDRWNWWLGALDLAYGGYRQFTVQAMADDPELDT
jgi:hypothetical protein